ncbi:MAG: helicase-related protein, partial [Rhizobiaceae bacterium]
YPIIDATTVKRTRQFVKKHYSGDLIRLPDGTEATIAFPEPKAITVRYPLSEPLVELFDLIEDALDPDGDNAITFARYVPDAYALHDEDDLDGDAPAATTIGLLRSGLLKRFESSAFAFSATLEKMAREHRTFLAALDKGHVIRTELIREVSAVDDDELEELLTESGQSIPAGQFKVAALRKAVEGDLDKIQRLGAAAVRVASTEDTKLVALAEALVQIAREAADEAVSDEDAQQKRKVLIFSFFADTVVYLRKALGEAAKRDTALAPYLGRMIAVAGSTDVDKETDVGRQGAVFGFAPISTEATGHEDLFDLLITTDILAEGVNLQQCRHIINYDVPWNPMRLVQRHGRVDRIGSPHKRVFLRTIFPAERLDQLLSLEQRIMEKIAMAAASVGVISPVDGGAAGGQVFTETRAEIEKLLEEDPSLFERGSASAGQTGEEYRQTLRKALQENRERIQRMPYGSGSGMMKGDRTGLFYCAAVGGRTYLRFVPTTVDIKQTDAPIVSEVGTCLRIVECEPLTAREFSADLESAAIDLWQIARRDIYNAWMRETDPVNLQPRVRPLNLRVAEFIRAHRPAQDDSGRINKALDILEAPWPRREEIMLRDWFNASVASGSEKAAVLVDHILDSGLQPFEQPKLLPPIEETDIELVCWLGVVASESNW